MAARDIWVLHTGGLGDLVLAADLVAALKSDANSRVTLAARRAVAEIAALFPQPPDSIVPLDLPAAAPLSLDDPTVSELRRQTKALAGVPCNLAVAADCRPNYRMPVLAAALRPQRTVVSEANWPPVFTCELLRRLDLAPVPMETAGAGEGHELQRYAALAALAGARSPAATARAPWPKPPSPPEMSGAPYLACFPLTAGANHVKRWPAERFQRVAGDFCAQRGWRVLLPGCEEERADLEQFALPLRRQLGENRVSVRIARSGDLPPLAALLANAAAYLGNSTGPYHLASAYGVPGVTVHCGDTWPSYGPWAAGSIGVVHPMACFGCALDCVFGRGVCTESVPESTVSEALAEAVENPSAPPRVVRVDVLSPEMHSLIREANRAYRVAQSDRAGQNETIAGLHRQLVDAVATIEARHSVTAHLQTAFRLMRERIGV